MFPFSLECYETVVTVMDFINTYPYKVTFRNQVFVDKTQRISLCP